MFDTFGISAVTQDRFPDVGISIPKHDIAFLNLENITATHTFTFY